MRAIGFVFTIIVLLSACTSSTDQGIKPLSTTSTEPAAPTTTTEATTTTTEPPPTEMELLTDQLLEFHDEYFFELPNVDTDEPGAWDQFLGWYDTNAIDPVKSISLGNFTEDRDQGLHLQGYRTIGEVVEVDWHDATTPAEVASNRVTVKSCTVGLMAAYYPDGSEETPRGGMFTYYLVDYVYDLDEDRFRVQSFTQAERCDPAVLLDGYGTHYTTESELDAVLDVHTEYLTVALGGIDQRVEGYESTRKAGARLAVDAELERLNRALDAWEENGELSDGAGYESHPQEIRVEQDQAVIIDCTRFAATTYDADGNVVDPANDFYSLDTSYLIKRDGQWYVNFFWIHGDQECKP